MSSLEMELQRIGALDAFMLYANRTGSSVAELFERLAAQFAPKQTKAHIVVDPAIVTSAWAEITAKMEKNPIAGFAEMHQSASRHPELMAEEVWWDCPDF